MSDKVVSMLMLARSRRPQDAPAKGKQARRKRPDPDSRLPSEDEVDEALRETFPASDPPSWAPLARLGAPKRVHD
jgi:hypothetical protein